MTFFVRAFNSFNDDNFHAGTMNVNNVSIQCFYRRMGVLDTSFWALSTNTVCSLQICKWKPQFVCERMLAGTQISTLVL